MNRDLCEARERLLSDPPILRRKVSVVSARGDTDPYAVALYTLAAGERFNWTPEHWNAVMDKLDHCEMKVGDWLEGVEA